MNYPAQMEFYNYNLDDVFVMSRDISLAIVQLFGASAFSPRLLGQ